VIADLVRERGPLTVAAFMDLALYHPELGYYARAARRTGRAGDFFTSVDVGPLFGELLAAQIAEMAHVLASVPSPSSSFDLIEAGAGNGQLAADILRALAARDPRLLERLVLTLVEASAAARAEHDAIVGEVTDRPFTSSPALPESFEGVLLANELLDAFPVHQVVMHPDGMKEVYVEAATDFSGGADLSGPPRLQIAEGATSTPALAAYLQRAGVTLERGWRAEVNLRALDWVREAARKLRRGFIILIDYGHPASELYSASHSAGTLTTFSRHVAQGAEADPRTPSWLQNPGGQDITAHVDFTSIRAAAEGEGLIALAFLDQTYFILGLLSRLGSLEPVDPASPRGRTVRQLKTLLLPGGLGSTMKVLILGKGVGTPALAGASFRMRVT
jgi:SAM-dependent MidA family methyltransferase